MTVRAISGLVAFNLLVLVCGASVLWLARGWRTWLELARLGGLAYLTGVAAVGVVWTLLLVVGVPFSGWLILLTGAVLVSLGFVGGRRLGRQRPTFPPLGRARVPVVAAIGIALTVLFVEALFRRARLSGLYNWDAWAFWVPKGKAIYFFGGLDEGFFTSLPGSSYPPLVPILDAAAFHAMGSVDVNTLHLQYWFLGAGFLWALAGLLSERAPAWILWPSVLVLLVAPRLGPRFTVPEADLLLDFFFAVAAVLLVLWLLDGERWRLVVATVLLCGMVLTKREGLLLAAFLVVATLLGSLPLWRSIWKPLQSRCGRRRRVAVPGGSGTWRMEAGEGAGAGGGGLPRRTPSAVALAPAGAGRALRGRVLERDRSRCDRRARPRRVRRKRTCSRCSSERSSPRDPGRSWITWAIPELEISRIWARTRSSATWVRRRCSAHRDPASPGGSVVGRDERRDRADMTVRVGVAVAIVLVPLLGYPLVTLAGGSPRFPSEEECGRLATDDDTSFDVVYGRDCRRVRARRRCSIASGNRVHGGRGRARRLREWKVFYDSIDSLEQGESLAEQVRAAGFEARVEVED